MAYLAAQNGILFADPNKDWRVTGRALESHMVSAVTVGDGFVLAGTNDGMFRSTDGGHTWHEASSGLDHRHVRWLAVHPQQARMAFAGTEPAGIFVSHNGGESWQACPEVMALRDRFHWSLPYSPEAGCVRGFAFHGERAYAAVEVGGVLVSDDSGANWGLAEGSDGRPNFTRPAAPMIHADVHSIYVHPSSPDLVYAPTGGGFYTSIDGGKTWRCMYDCYVRAAWIDPNDPAHIVLGPADGVDRNGRIEESFDSGETWQAASDGLAVPWSRHMVERFAPVNQQLVAVLSNGEVMVRHLGGGAWRQVLQHVEGVNAVA